MPLETDRLLLTPLRPGDERWLWPFMSDPLTLYAWDEPYSHSTLADWVGWSLEAEQQWGLGRHLLRLKSSGQVVGDCGFFWWQWQGRDLIDAGWIVDRRHWRQGYAGEAMRALLPALFARGHRETWAKVPWTNRASWQTALALGFEPQGEFRYEGLRWDRMLLGRLGAPTPTLPRARPGGRG